MKTYMQLIAFCVFTLLACNTKDHTQKTMSGPDLRSAIQLQGSPMGLDTMFLGLMDVWTSGEYLLIKDIGNAGNFYLHLLSVPSGELLASFCPDGKGPGEFISPKITHFSEDEIIVYDNTLFKLVTFQLHTKAHELKVELTAEKKIPESLIVASTPYLLHDQIVTDGFYPDARIKVLDLETNTLINIQKDLPFNTDYKSSARTHAIALQGPFCVNQEKSIAAIGTRYANLLQFFELETGILLEEYRTGKDL
jgi:hypothetical protein